MPGACQLRYGLCDGLKRQPTKAKAPGSPEPTPPKQQPTKRSQAHSADGCNARACALRCFARVCPFLLTDPRPKVAVDGTFLPESASCGDRHVNARGGGRRQGFILFVVRPSLFRFGRLVYCARRRDETLRHYGGCNAEQLEAGGFWDVARQVTT
jgi:hypothetical protein